MEYRIIPVEKELVLSSLEKRQPDCHKGTFGYLCVLAGSSAYRGSATLACGAALRSGAGIVCLASVEPVISTLMTHHPECTLLPLSMNEAGGIARENIDVIRERVARSSAVLIGCGMGMHRDTGRVVKSVLSHAACPIVIDADGLHALAEKEDFPALLKSCKGSVILTPHMGEMSRLCSMPIEKIKANPAGIAAKYAEEWNCVIVLKDDITHTALPGGTVYRNTTGNAGLARGGSGDVLAGMIASFLAQGKKAEMAAVLGVYLHGAAADEIIKERSVCGMLPSDLLNGVCRWFLENDR